MQDLKRTSLSLLLGAAALIGATAVALPQDAAKPPATKSIRVGLFLSGFAPEYAVHERGLVEGLRGYGYVEGRNLVVERRYAQLSPERIASLAQEFARMQLNALVTICTFSTKAALTATTSTPIVMLSVADPVGLGLAHSLRRPGNNVTGRSSLSRDLIPKLLELFHEAVPAVDRIAVLVNTHNSDLEPLWEDAVAAARRLNLSLIRIAAALPDEFDMATERISKSGAKALFVLPDDPSTLHLHARLAEFAERHAIPLFGPYSGELQGRAMLSYGENLEVTARESAAYIEKVVRGASPAELPIEQPTRFELGVNLKVAKQLGIAIPPSVMVRADRLIE
jgi:ABC-type uncharacterized transport system substrate-binding protein